MSPAVDKVNKKTEVVEKTIMDYSQIAQNPIQHVLTTVEKKVRNLDKRKAKLDGYRKIVSQGGTLDRDQTAAVNKYDEVSGSLDFARELYKSLGSVQSEVMKAQRKIQRQEEEDRQENRRLQFEFVAKCQFVFKLFLENKSISEDFINGTNSASIIPQEELEDIVQFYKNYIDGVKYDVSINVFEKALSAAEHMELLFDGSEANVCGTTYKNLRATLDTLFSCDYFTSLPELNQEMEQLDEDQDEEEGVEYEEVENTEDTQTDDEKSKEEDETEVQSISPTEDSEPAVDTSSDSTAAEVTNAAPVQQVQTIEDVLAGVQGEYNFLQDSMLDFSGGDNVQLNGQMNPLPNNESPDLQYNPNLPPSNIGMDNLHGYSDDMDILKHNETPDITHKTVSDTFYSQRATENDMAIPAANNDIEHFRNEAPTLKDQSYQNFDRTNQMKIPYNYVPSYPLDHMSSSHNPGMPPSSIPSIDPPTTHIPLPNEEDSGYKAYKSENLDEKQIAAKQVNQPQRYHDDKMMPMKLQKPSEGVDNAFKNGEVVKGSQNKSHQDGLEIRENGGRDQRNNRQNDHPGMGSYQPHGRQPNNGVNRQRGNYRSNNANRNFGGHFDSMGHPKNYGPQSNYQNQPYGYQNIRQQDNQMYGNMQRRGAGGNGRPNRGYPPRGNMNRGMGNPPMNRPRNMKNLKPEQPA